MISVEQITTDGKGSPDKRTCIQCEAKTYGDNAIACFKLSFAIHGCRVLILCLDCASDLMLELEQATASVVAEQNQEIVVERETTETFQMFGKREFEYVHDDEHEQANIEAMTDCCPDCEGTGEFDAPPGSERGVTLCQRCKSTGRVPKRAKKEPVPKKGEA